MVINDFVSNNLTRRPAVARTTDRTGCQ